jgi:hypothetical protein
MHLASTNCSLAAIVGGKPASFPDASAKFDALADSWDDVNLGRSVIDYHDTALLQIIGMGTDAIPFLLQRVANGHSEWIYALKCITGQDAESPDMHGDEDRVIDAWISWGKRNGYVEG